MAVILQFKDFNKFCGVKVKNFKPPEVKLTVTCGDLVQKDLGKDPLWNQRIVNALQKVFDSEKGTYRRLADEIDQKIGQQLKASDKATTKNEVGDIKRAISKLGCRIKKDLRIAAERIETKAKQTAESGWNTLLSVKKDYKSYQLKADTKLDFTGGELVASIATAAAGQATLGTGSIVGLISVAQKITSMGSQLHTLSLEAEGVLKRLDQDFAKLQSVYETQKPWVAHPREVTAQTLDDFFSEPLMRSVELCSKRSQLAANQLKAFVVGSHKLSKHLKKLLAGSAEFEKQIKKYKGSREIEKKAKKAMKRLAAIQEGIRERISQTLTQGTQAKIAHERLATLRSMLKQVETKTPSAVKTVAEIARLGVGFGASISASESIGQGLVPQLKTLARAMVQDAIIERV